MFKANDHFRSAATTVRNAPSPSAGKFTFDSKNVTGLFDAARAQAGVENVRPSTRQEFKHSTDASSVCEDNRETHSKAMSQQTRMQKLLESIAASQKRKEEEQRRRIVSSTTPTEVAGIKMAIEPLKSKDRCDLDADTENAIALLCELSSAHSQASESIQNIVDLKNHLNEVLIALKEIDGLFSLNLKW